MRACDVILTHANYPQAKIIRWGQHLRYDDKYARWGHAAIAYDGNVIIEALGKGVVKSNVAKYKNTEHIIYRPPLTATQWAVDALEIIQFATHAVGREYGYLEIVSCAIALLSNCKLVFGLDNQMICSGLVASCLSRGQFIFPKEPMYMMPADLAKFAHENNWKVIANET